MSGVSAGRLGMLTWNVMFPASSFDTVIAVMSGAAGFSPVESWKVCELLALAVTRRTLPSAVLGSGHEQAAAARSPSRSPIAQLPVSSCRTPIFSGRFQRPVR